MRIAIDTIPLLSPLTGIGHYVDQLVRGFNRLAPDNDYTYYSGFFSKTPRRGGRHAEGLKKILGKIPLLMSGLNRSRGALARLGAREFDLYFQPNFIPLDIKAKKTVATVHDFAFMAPQPWHPKYRVEYFAKNFKKNIMRADRIITDSAFIKNEALGVLGVPQDKISAIPLGVDHEVFRKRDPNELRAFKDQRGLSEPFILFVGTLEPRKNLRRLLEAYLDLPEPVKKGYRLVLAGSEGWNSDDLREILAKMKDRVTYLGYLKTEEIACLYNLASLFVFPSLYEGFGLPPLEAMACGCPVVVSRAASLPEVCGDAAQYVDPEDARSISEGMHKVLSDEELRRRLSRAGEQRAQLFSWESAAKRTLAVFEEVLR